MAPHDASLCIDGNLNTFCHSQTTTNPWLSVAVPLGTSARTSTVSQVLVYNRADPDTWYRLSPFQLWLGTSIGDFNSETSTECGVSNITVPSSAGPFSFNCNGATGSFVTLVLPGIDRTLHVADLKIFSPF